ncbi:MAG: putative Ig domain-containing protein, partial [Clostridia bacterium]|nr:putative Ig domain-containing protein [Clostridia bacterium]
GAPTDGPESTPEPAGDKNVEIVTETLPDAVKGKNYSEIIEVKGEEPVTLSLTGVLPEGLKFNSSNGEIYGTPEKTGTYSFIIKAETASGTVEKALALNVVKKSSVGKVFGIIGIVLGSAAVLAGGAALALFLIKKKHA